MSALSKQEKLVRMANQMADFFRSYPEEEAVTQTESHLTKFWDPRMKRDLKLLVEAGGEGLSATALAAARRVVERVQLP